MQNEILIFIKMFILSLSTALILSACGGPSDDSKRTNTTEAETSTTDTSTTDTTTTDINSTTNNENTVQGENELCLQEVYADGTKLDTCMACHVDSGFASSTDLVFSPSNPNYNYNALKNFLSLSPANASLLVNKIDASSSVDHVGGKFFNNEVNYLQNFVDTYKNQDSCTLTENLDTGSTDTGNTDTNSTDTGNTDTGSTDTGSTTTNLDGSALYIQQCASCHGDNGEGGFGGPFFVKDSNYQSQHTMVAYLAETMPITDVQACGTECSTAIYEYAKLNFYNPNDVNNTDTGSTQVEEMVCQDGEISTSPQYMRLLSSDEYKNSVNDLLGFNSNLTDSLPADAVSGNFKNAAINTISDTSKMEAYLTVALNLSEEAIDRYKGNIISCSATSSGNTNTGTCSLNTYTAGTSYAVNEKVQHLGRYFECKVAGWCSQNHIAYEPGVGFGSDSAWTELNQCPTTTTTTVQTSTDENCVADFVEDFGLKAYRRPLSASEKLAYENMIDAAVSFDNGLKDVVASILISPNFLYRSEVGVDTQDGYARLNAYETASALSYLLWGSIPDQTLLDAAASGQLNTSTGIRFQAERMIDDEKAKKQIVKFTSQWLHTDIDSIGQKASSAFNISGVKESLVAEFETMTQYAIYEGSGNFSELMDANYFFANDKLNTYYELNANISGSSMKKQDKLMINGEKVRGGILRSGAFLASHGQFDETGALSRGAFIRREVLCDELPIPPVSTPTFDTTPPVHNDSITTRELFNAHTSAPQCFTCHKSFNDLGFAFENYEGDGRFREDEHGLEIVQGGTLLGLKERLDNISIDFENRDALIDTLANEDAIVECYATQYFRFAKGYIEKEQDSCALATLKQKFVQSGGNIKTLMVELTQLPSFTQRAN